MARLLRGDALVQRAEELGVSMHETIGGTHGLLKEPELQRRLMEAERSMREGRLWLVALASAIASAISAAGAWWAVMSK